MDYIRISIISAIVSFSAAMYSLSQAKTAKKALIIHQKKFENEKPKISMEILVSYVIRDKVNLISSYYIETIISNNSDMSNSIKQINFIFKGNKATIKIKATDKSDDIHKGYNFLSQPVNFEAHSSSRGWLKFNLNSSDALNLKIDTHFLEIIDISENIYLLEEIFIEEKDISNGK